MYKKILSSDVFGLEGFFVDVEVDVSDGFPKFDIVGLPDSAIKEAAERVRAAIRNSGIAFPYQRIIVNLAPANIRKSGTIYDLAIAIGVLATQNQVKSSELSHTIIIGELTLDGRVSGVAGVLSIVDFAERNGIKRCILPSENYLEAKTIQSMELIPVEHLKDAINFFNKGVVPSFPLADVEERATEHLPDFEDICGQSIAKRALQIAVAGRHHLVLLGPPGSGKTMMAKRVPSLMPPLSFEESKAITKIYSISNLINGKGLVNVRPFRAPHHTLSGSALSGGGKIPKPGEITLAHGGVLFLDEILEFNRNVLEILRQPLEDKQITISRVNGKVTFPADFMLVGSLNPCPCGYFPDKSKCNCSPSIIQNYLNKLSGPLLDRIDIQVEVQPIVYNDLKSNQSNVNSETLKSKVLEVVNIQKMRFQNECIDYNAQMENQLIRKYCVLTQEAERILKDAFEKLGMSVRGHQRILKVSRTIADFDASEKIEAMHIIEAISYRSLDKKYWNRTNN